MANISKEHVLTVSMKLLPGMLEQNHGYKALEEQQLDSVGGLEHSILRS